jgi:hypothetical protein
MRVIYIFLSFYLIFQINVKAQSKSIDKLYYAHIDKELYLPDENIWFKIYIHNPYFLDNKSSNIYVDLVDENKKFVGVVNDGDIRRAFSSGYDVNSSIRNAVNKKPFFIRTILDLNSFSSRELNELSYIPIIKNKKIYGLYLHNINSNTFIYY